MGLISAFNEVLSCILTGLSAAIFLGIFGRMGLLPMFYLSSKGAEEPTKEEE